MDLAYKNDTIDAPADQGIKLLQFLFRVVFGGCDQKCESRFRQASLQGLDASRKNGVVDGWKYRPYRKGASRN